MANRIAVCGQSEQIVWDTPDPKINRVINGLEMWLK
jgi:hypothetical protein